MAGTTRFLSLNPPIIGTPNFWRQHQFPRAMYSPFSSTEASPLHLKLRSVSRRRITAASSQSAQGKGEEGGSQIPQVTISSWALKFVSGNFLPLALVSGVVFGLVNPGLGCLADRCSLSKYSSFGIFVLSGLTLRSDEIGVAAEAWPVGLFGIFSILFFSPFFSKIIMMLKLQPQEFVTGLAIFTCMPTTLSSGVALTRLAGGNSALALAMTVISNLLGILIIPFSVSKFVASGVGVIFPTEKLLRSLTFTLLVPLMLGKVARESSKDLANLVDGNRKVLSVVSAVLLSLVPWIQVSRSRSLLLMVKPSVFLVAVMMGALLHSALLAFNAFSIRSISVVSGGSKSVFSKEGNAKALLLVASQKTLPVMVAVVEQLGGALGESGLLVLPCVAAHLNQIIIDSFLINLWRQKEDALDNTQVS